MVTDQIEREITIAAPVERVWELITDPEHVGRWFGDAGAEIDLRPGGEMAVHWHQHGTALARVERVEPTTHFSYRWAPFSDPGGTEPTAENSTLVEFTLAAEGAWTRLRVVESGFAALATTDKQRLENLAGNVEGWRVELDELNDYAARVTAG